MILWHVAHPQIHPCHLQWLWSRHQEECWSGAWHIGYQGQQIIWPLMKVVVALTDLVSGVWTSNGKLEVWVVWGWTGFPREDDPGAGRCFKGSSAQDSYRCLHGQWYKRLEVSGLLFGCFWTITFAQVGEWNRATQGGERYWGWVEYFLSQF